MLLLKCDGCGCELDARRHKIITVHKRTKDEGDSILDLCEQCAVPVLSRNVKDGTGYQEVDTRTGQPLKKSERYEHDEGHQG